MHSAFVMPAIVETEQKMPIRMLIDIAASSPVNQGPSAPAHASAKPAADSTIEAIEVGVKLCGEGGSGGVSVRLG